jgi:hypothetical protein
MKNYLLINRTYVIKKEDAYEYIDYDRDRFYARGSYKQINCIDEISDEYFKNHRNLIFL